MSAEAFKARVRGHGEQSRKSETAKGRGYHLVRSKFVKGKDNYGKIVTSLREKLLAANGGKDPGPDVVAMHKFPGAHKGTTGKDMMGKFGSRASNTASSNRLRARKK
jgi:hypothetical protein